MDFTEFETFAIAPMAWGQRQPAKDVEEFFRDRLLLHAGAVAFEHAEQPGFEEPLAEDNLMLAALAAIDVIDRWDAVA